MATMANGRVSPVLTKPKSLIWDLTVIRYSPMVSSLEVLFLIALTSPYNEHPG